MTPSQLAPQFPILKTKVNGHPLVYLDNAATTQRPQVVIDAINTFNAHQNANVHRGVHTLSYQATDLFEDARHTVKTFLNANSEQEIIFTKGCTEAINLVAHSWGITNLKPGDQILLSTAEHHANIVPWQIVAKNTGAKIIPIPINDQGEINFQAYQDLLNPKVKLVSVKHICNALGTINPIQEIIALAHKHQALVLIDGAQALAHTPVDVQALNADFYTTSAHKVYGPMGIGALYAKQQLLEAMPPYQAGGDMILTVSFESTTYNDLPNRFEPGTPNVSAAIAFAEALKWVTTQGIPNLAKQEAHLLQYATEQIKSIDGITIIGPTHQKAGIISFTTNFAHPHDIGTVLDQLGVAIRTGHHCCMPLMTRLNLPGTARASLAVYNTNQDIDTLVFALKESKRLFS